MKITHEIRKYIIKDDDKRYSVSHNIKENVIRVLLILENDDYPDRNLICHFDVPDSLMKKIKKKIKDHGK